MNKSKKRLSIDLEKWMKALNVMIDTLTPEDTWNMIKNTQRDEIVQEWNLIVWRIHNDATDEKWFPYPLVVEEWVWWKKYMYQKPKWNKWWYVWSWVHTFARALAAMKPVILQFLKR